MSDERLVQAEPEVLEGEDELPRRPDSHRDPFVPEPGPRPGERRAWNVMRIATFAIVIFVIAIVVIALVR